MILAQCDAALADETLNGEHRQQIELIEKKARNMAQIISQLLLLSRADQGRQQLQMESLNLSELTEMVCEEQSISQAEEKNRLQSAHRLSRNCMLPQTKPFISGCLSI